MRLFKIAPVILALWVSGQGCGPLSYATRTLIIEPVHYCITPTAVYEIHRDYGLAETAWQEITKANPDPSYSPDYVCGFKDGFADFLYAGGTGEPPPLPPRQYWKIKYETAEGHQAIEDWFAGFRHGASVAQTTGYRQWVTIPSSLPPRAISEGHASCTMSEAIPVPPSESVLPPPRKAVPSKAPDKDSPGSGPSTNAPGAATPASGPSGKGRADQPVRVVVPLQ